MSTAPYSEQVPPLCSNCRSLLVRPTEDFQLKYGQDEVQITVLEEELIKAKADGCPICVLGWELLQSPASKLYRSDGSPLRLALTTACLQDISDLENCSISQSRFTMSEMILWINAHIPANGRAIARLAIRDNASNCGRITYRRYKYTSDGVVNKISQGSLSINTTRLESNTGTPARLELAEKWIKNCFENHSQCRQASQADHPGSCPSRLIDVTSPGRPRLVLKDEIPINSVVYVTLSHRWRDSHMLKLLRENIEAMKYGIVMESLPPVFRDAIQFCGRLRVKYL